MPCSGSALGSGKERNTITYEGSRTQTALAEAGNMVSGPHPGVHRLTCS